jgi:predicted GNAT family N-acyltransferase
MDLQIVSWKGVESPWHAVARNIRYSVFIEEQKVDEHLEYEHEEESTHYLVFEQEQAVATARWRQTKDGIKLERFAVLAPYRNHGLGSIMLQRVLEDVVGQKAIIYLHSQLRAVPYYKRADFIEAGPHFVEADIDHVKMIYQASV